MPSWNKVNCIVNNNILYTRQFYGIGRHGFNQNQNCSYTNEYRTLFLLLSSLVESPSSRLSPFSRIRRRTMASSSSSTRSSSSTAATGTVTLLKLLLPLSLSLLQVLLLVLSSQVDNCHGLSLSLSLGSSPPSFIVSQNQHVTHHTRQRRRSFEYMTMTFMTKKKQDIILDDDDYDEKEGQDYDMIEEEIFATDDIESLWLLGNNDDDEEEEEEEEDGDTDTKLKASASTAAPKVIDEVTKVKPLTSPPSKQQQTQTQQDIDTKTSLISSLSSQTATQPRPRGVGRKGYNITLLHSINYDQTQYSAAHTASSFEIRIQLLQEYYDIHGDIDVPFRYNVTVDDYDTERQICGNYVVHLGRWLHWVRTLYKKDLETMNTMTTTNANTNINTNRLNRRRKIPLEYVDKLNSMNMNWDGVGARRRPNDFRKKCTELEEFIATHGHSYVPKNWAENKSLAMWVERQRFLYRRRRELEEGVARMGLGHGYPVGSQHQLTDDRIDMLRAIGFDFEGSFTTTVLGDSSRNIKVDGKRDMNIADVTGDISNDYNDDRRHENMKEELEEVFMSQNQIDFNSDWWNTLGLLKKYKDTYGHSNITLRNCQNIMTDDEVVLLSYWILEQKRQYMIFNGNNTAVHTEVPHYDSATPKINFKCLLTPERLSALTDLGFDLSMNDLNLSLSGSLPLSLPLSLILPGQNMIEYNFDCQRMLGLLQRHKNNTGDCNISLDDKTIMARITMTKDDTSKSVDDDDDDDDVNLVFLYLFQQRLRWENRHKSIRSQVPQINWILEQEEIDVEDVLDKMGFSWYDQEIPDSSNVWAREIEWWCNYYDLCRYKRSNDDFALDPYGNWYSEELVDWLEEQRQNYIQMIEETGQNGEIRSNNKDANYFYEWHLQALHDAGLDLNGDEYSYYTQSAYVNGPKPVGRPPAILKLEKDLENQYNNLPDDLQSIVNNSANRKRVDKAEQLAWLVRYEALRRLYSLHGRGSLSTLSTDKDVCDQRLALWASNQRKQYANYLKGNKSALTPSRIKLLEEINFDWELQSEDDEWGEMKAALMNFKKEHDHCFVPAAYTKDLRLGQWVHLQRQLYQLSKRDDIIDVAIPSKLNEEKMKELIDIGLDLTMDNFSFGNIAFETMWTCRVEELQRFKEEHGHCNVILDYTSKYYDLSLWVNEQRILYQRAKEGIGSQLDGKRMKDLEKLGFLWNEEIELSE